MDCAEIYGAVVDAQRDALLLVIRMHRYICELAAIRHHFSLRSQESIWEVVRLRGNLDWTAQKFRLDCAEI